MNPLYSKITIFSLDAEEFLPLQEKFAHEALFTVQNIHETLLNHRAVFNACVALSGEHRAMLADQVHLSPLFARKEVRARALLATLLRFDLTIERNRTNGPRLVAALFDFFPYLRTLPTMQAFFQQKAPCYSRLVGPVEQADFADTELLYPHLRPSFE